MGSAVKVHPVTVMILMLISGSLYGILGMIIAVPAYCLVKEIVKFANSLYNNHKAEQRKIISKWEQKYDIIILSKLLTLIFSKFELAKFWVVP